MSRDSDSDIWTLNQRESDLHCQLGHGNVACGLEMLCPGQAQCPLEMTLQAAKVGSLL